MLRFTNVIGYHFRIHKFGFDAIKSLHMEKARQKLNRTEDKQGERKIELQYEKCMKICYGAENGEISERQHYSQRL